MKQSILIGLGGAGSRIVNSVAERIQNEKLTDDENKTVCAVMDTDCNDLNRIRQSETNIVTVQLSEPKSIDMCLRMHEDMNPKRWCAVTPTMAFSSMMDGTGGIRMISRIVFMDVISSPRMEKLIREFEKILSAYDNNNTVIQIEIVSSLAGGTGSGMFILVALWLQKFFKDRARIVIRGVFLLPDVFYHMYKDINPRVRQEHYANTYAAVRELNAIDNAIKNPEEAKKAAPIIIDGLFDSHHMDIHTLFHSVVLVDDTSNGLGVHSIDAYYEMVADTVYLQLYSPSSEQLCPVEDVKNEMWRYRSIYAIPPESIAKLDEFSEGGYYQAYQDIVNCVLFHKEAGYVTPHIDKTWHWVLPYVTTDMCRKSQQEFYETLWKSIAYRQVLVKDGEYHFIEYETKLNGERCALTKQLIEDGKAIATDETVRLVRALKSGDWLEFFAKPMLEGFFQKDIDTHENTITDFVNNLGSSEDQNPVTMMVRYIASAGGERAEFDELKEALVRLLRRIVLADSQWETEAEIEKAVADVVHGFFEKCSLPDKEVFFGDWA